MGVLNLEAWTIRDLQTIAALLQTMSEAGVQSLAEARALVNGQMSAVIASLPKSDTFAQVAARKDILCPECGDVATVSAINVSPCTRVGGAWRAIIQCRCGWEELSLLTPRQLLSGQ